MEFSCSKCGIIFTQRCNLLRHMRKSHEARDQEKFTCDECGKRLSTKYSLQHHWYTQHSSKDKVRFTCVECGKIFSTKYNLKTHLSTEHPSRDKERFLCEKCGKTFSAKYNLKYHWITQHSRPTKLDTLSSLGAQPSTSTPPPETSSSSEQLPPSSPVYHCYNCGSQFIFQKTLVRHLKSFCAEGPQLQTSTPPSESSSASLPQATPSTSGQCPPPPPPASPPPRFRCMYCETSYLRRSNLIHHVRYNHHENGIESCNYCGETFTRRQDLSRHLSSACPALKECYTPQTLLLNQSCTRSTKSVQRIAPTDKLEQTEKPGENTLCDEDLEAAAILMTMSRASTSKAMPTNTPHPYDTDQPRIPPDLPARVQHWMREESLNQNVTDNCE